jgi:hypothetical protein
LQEHGGDLVHGDGVAPGSNGRARPAAAVERGELSLSLTLDSGRLSRSSAGQCCTDASEQCSLPTSSSTSLSGGCSAQRRGGVSLDLSLSL